MDFGLIFFFVIIGVFIVIEIILWISKKDNSSNEKTAIVKTYDRIVALLRKSFRRLFPKK
jgi:uncharacterized protein YggT (Ycf19 family)